MIILLKIVDLALSEAHSQRANLIIIKDHFDKFYKIIEEHLLTTDQIWNMDETDGALADTVIGFTNSEYMRKDLFQMYIEHFINFIPSSHPVLLMLDVSTQVNELESQQSKKRKTFSFARHLINEESLQMLKKADELA
ncbi:13550_t:CDS:2 [Cetraspora pellucida]|uniref:13550_t:CDS:1 n=1 Tax=Cetraspora pellucida TaxID=1433469 RepID=A0A9N9DGR4_9GLOM|nr:13550_t:CDS:2 [Cetraspora pellucida]